MGPASKFVIQEKKTEVGVSDQEARDIAVCDMCIQNRSAWTLPCFWF